VEVSRGHIENPLVLAQIHAFAEFFANQLQRVADDGIIAAREGPMLTCQGRPMVDSWGISRKNCVHDIPPPVSF
jgi:hypothetical protein